MAMFLNVSNDLTQLSAKLTSAISARQADPFKPHWLVTQTEGMNAWLKLRIAGDLGIAANIRFNKPNDIIDMLHFMLAGNERLLLDKETMRWQVYSILAGEDFKQAHPAIAAYYRDNDIKQIALADEMTDLFDQYQVYRNEAIEQWNLNMDEQDDDHKWQSWIWRKLKQNLGDQYMDKTQLSKIILEKINDPLVQDKIRTKIPELHFFGLAVVTPYYLGLFHAMSRFMDIHFYLVNPAPEKYWLNSESEKQVEKRIAKLRGVEKEYTEMGNDLLVNWGKITRESFQLLFRSDDFINVYNNVGDIEFPDPVTLLGKVQYDIHENLPAEERKPITKENEKDGSLVINGCYSPAREVEVLYNYLVDLVVNAGDQRISPRDILVCVSDVGLYAPYIKAIFRNAPYEFPFSIADEPVTAENNLFTALQDILSMDTHPFKAESVMQLLESPYIRDRFGITDVDALRIAVRQAGIRYSIEGRREDDTRLVSWAYGMKRIIYGICMSGEGRFNDGEDELIPLDTVEGAPALERVRFVHFVNVLLDKLQKRDRERTISEWADYLNEIVSDLIYLPGDEDDADYGQFVNIMEEMYALQESYTEKVSYQVFRHSFMDKLELSTRGATFASQGITFASMVPMRSIPFKVVALLGMDFNKFPRKETGVSFNIIAREQRLGDRDIKGNDKHLFLESLLSAKEKLYISYISRNDKDNVVLPPSSLVDELIDYIARGAGEDTDKFRERFVTEHPLQGNSVRYGPNKLTTYLNDDRFRTGIDVREGDANLKEVNTEEVDIDQLVAFMKNPFKAYYQKQLSVRYEEDEILLPEHEVFELDHLQRWQLQQGMLSGQQNLSDYLEEMKLKGEVPLANMSKVALDRIEHDRKFSNLRKLYHDHIAGKEKEFREINVDIDGSRLKGKCNDVFGDAKVSVCNSGNWPKYLLSGIAPFLAAVASGHEIGFCFFTKSDGEYFIKPGQVKAEQAKEILKQWLTLMKRGHRELVEFYPSMLKTIRKNTWMVDLDYEAFEMKVNDKLEDEDDRDFNDDYLVKAADNGVFAEERYPNWQQNVNLVKAPLKDWMPALF